MRTSEHTSDLITALVKARKSFKAVVKDTTGQVAQRQYKYADLSTILDATVLPLLENGLVLTQAPDPQTATLVTRLSHASGEWIEGDYPLGHYDKPQEQGSALTYARRYSLQALLCLAAEDDDGASAQQTERSSSSVSTYAYAPSAPHPSAAKPAHPPTTHSGVLYVTSVTTEDATSKAGKPFKRYVVTFSDMQTATTIDRDIASDARLAMETATPVLIETKKFGRMTDLLAIGPTKAPDDHPPADAYGPETDSPIPF